MNVQYPPSHSIIITLAFPSKTLQFVKFNKFCHNARPSVHVRSAGCWKSSWPTYDVLTITPYSKVTVSFLRQAAERGCLVNSLPKFLILHWNLVFLSYMLTRESMMWQNLWNSMNWSDFEGNAKVMIME